ncbi:Inositol-tetrakisphosphate 1-kinase [Cichlidogyrus casuarinus]|uniref:inositol-1,3,4-trisphosphate 5/6-kinase n=1 Tax=Cichlidogyrus casuarinus TaxID=1844966 RepID=A0ABD2Q2N3_9PLAT
MNTRSPILDAAGCSKTLNNLQILSRFGDRYEELNLCSSICASESLRNDTFVPKYTKANAYSQSLGETFVFPAIVKPIVSRINTKKTQNPHNFSIIFNEDQLKTVAYPCVIQEFLDHGDFFYKIYVIGDFCDIQIRPTKKLSEVEKIDENVISFNSRATCRVSPCQLTDSDSIPAETKKRLMEIGQEFRLGSGLDLFNMDALPCGSRFAVIDINVFPSFQSVPNRLEHLHNLVLKTLN